MMARLSLLLATIMALSGCAVVVRDDVPSVPPPPAVVGPRMVHIPPGHYPPPGHCRVWYIGRPPGQQPPPLRCDVVSVIPGSFVLYDNRAWDVDYNWVEHAHRQPGSVPRVIVDLTRRR